ncbi:unnamed protein product [Didymodactylos carnosus]|uniref:SNF7 family protein n=1 Tax=Didymodactylos carnosus TaxID=1234261 RepID=A0A813WSE6_9BILA|nr:unnamed protein product [Didymodactylos carnosus]CAF0859147.1 unnamed protein product [Didymodactylos carnosus]CAF3606326.1 unnamed protein product [Didymodactylos carnosus]CAF3646780.1 unnamed protein product [Didymodactylos carnosus]
MNWSRIFGKSKNDNGGGSQKRASNGRRQQSETAQEIIKFHNQEDLLNKKIDHLQEQVDSHREKAKECTRIHNRIRALTHMRKAKVLESQIEKFQGMLANLEITRGGLEQMDITKSVFDQMASGKSKLAAINKRLDISKVEGEMDGISELILSQKDVTDIMANPIIISGVSDMELNDELNKLDKEIEKESFSKISDLPNIPQQYEREHSTAIETGMGAQNRMNNKGLYELENFAAGL